ncbi:hypothetical protein HDE_04928 [Halotydeus destructor]|nr:hypothetical protein HDE_04928 [Halotydeus destructor]
MACSAVDGFDYAAKPSVSLQAVTSLPSSTSLANCYPSSSRTVRTTTPGHGPNSSRLVSLEPAAAKSNAKAITSSPVLASSEVLTNRSRASSQSSSSLLARNSTSEQCDLNLSRYHHHFHSTPNLFSPFTGHFGHYQEQLYQQQRYFEQFNFPHGQSEPHPAGRISGSFGLASCSAANHGPHQLDKPPPSADQRPFQQHRFRAVPHWNFGNDP